MPPILDLDTIAQVVEQPTRRAGLDPQGHPKRYRHLLQQTVQIVAGKQPAMSDQGETVGFGLDLREGVAGEYDRGAVRPQGSQREVEFPPQRRVESGGRFVQQQQPRFADQCLRKAQALAHALRIGADALLCCHAETDTLQQCHATGRRLFLEATVECDNFVTCHGSWESDALRQEAGITARLGAQRTGRIDPGDPYASRTGLDHAQDQFHQGRLARPIMSNKREDLALIERKRHIV